MLYNVRLFSLALWGSFIYDNVIPKALSGTNQICIVCSISIDGATLRILVLCVSWFARKLTHGQTDGRTHRRTDGHTDGRDRHTDRMITLTSFSGGKKR